MSTNSIIQTFGQRARQPARQADRAVAVQSLSPEAVEERRWLLLLGVPFVVSAAFFAAMIGTGIAWLLAPAMVFGPGTLIMAFVYLSISSDSNGEGQTR
jgi:hypothetical protein